MLRNGRNQGGGKAIPTTHQQHGGWMRSNQGLKHRALRHPCCLQVTQGIHNRCHPLLVQLLHTFQQRCGKRIAYPDPHVLGGAFCQSARTQLNKQGDAEFKQSTA